MTTTTKVDTTENRDETIRQHAMAKATRHLTSDPNDIERAVHLLAQAERYIAILDGPRPPTRNPVEAVMRLNVCDTCGAFYGQPCVTATGRLIGHCHANRFDLAHDMGLIDMVHGR